MCKIVTWHRNYLSWQVICGLCVGITSMTWLSHFRTVPLSTLPTYSTIRFVQRVCLSGSQVIVRSTLAVWSNNVCVLIGVDFGVSRAHAPNNRYTPVLSSLITTIPPIFWFTPNSLTIILRQSLLLLDCVWTVSISCSIQPTVCTIISELLKRTYIEQDNILYGCNIV